MKMSGLNLRLFFLLIFFLACPFFFNACMAMPTQSIEQDPLATAFLATKANLEEIRLSGWSRYGKKASLEQLQQATQETASMLKLSKLQASSHTGDMEEYILEGENSQGDWQLIFQTNEDGTYLIINLLSHAPVQNLTYMKSSLREALTFRAKNFPQEKKTSSSSEEESNPGSYDDEGEPNCLIIGTINGNISQLSLRNCFARAIEACSGILVEEASEDNYFSQCAYVPSLLPVVSLQNKNVNLHLAASYDEQKKQTFLYLGCPMIFTDY